MNLPTLQYLDATYNFFFKFLFFPLFYKYKITFLISVAHVQKPPCMCWLFFFIILVLVFKRSIRRTKRRQHLPLVILSSLHFVYLSSSRFFDAKSRKFLLCRSSFRGNTKTTKRTRKGRQFSGLYLSSFRVSYVVFSTNCKKAQNT